MLRAFPLLFRHRCDVVRPVIFKHCKSNQLTKMSNHAEGNDCRFTVNQDGTISPMGAPHLALGFHVPAGDFKNIRSNDT